MHLRPSMLYEALTDARIIISRETIPHPNFHDLCLREIRGFPFWL